MFDEVVISSGDQFVSSVRDKLNGAADLCHFAVSIRNGWEDLGTHSGVLLLQLFYFLLPQFDQTHNPRVQTEGKVALVSVQSKLTEAQAR
jgi:hypothetical protein